MRELLERKDVETFLPTVVRWSRWKDRKKKLNWPLFPGYCFARFNPAESLAVVCSHGVAGIVSFAGAPAPIPEDEIYAIQRLVSTDLAYDSCPLLREGAMVEVVHGPLLGVVGILLRKKARARLVLSVSLIGQAVSVEIDAADVRPSLAPPSASRVAAPY